MAARAPLVAVVVLVAVIAGSAEVVDRPAHRPAPVAAPPEASDATVPGIDVSAYQHGVDWTKAADRGARFAYIKATEGDEYTSARFHEQNAGARRAGLITGAFHFATPNRSTPVAQARHFVRAVETLGAAPADGQPTLPPLIDLEYDPYVRTDGTDSCWGLTPRRMVFWISAFVDTVIELTGRVPAIYTTTDWWNTCTGDSVDFVASPLFLARYVDDYSSGAGDLPSAWRRWTIWQYTSTGSRYAGVTDGSKGDTPASDEDVFAGSMADLRRLSARRFADEVRLSPKSRDIVRPR